MIKLSFVALTLSSSALAQQSVTEQAKKDLLESQQRLTAQRESLSDTQIELASKVTTLKAERDQKLRKVQLSRKSKEARATLLNELSGKEYASNLAVSELSQMLKQYGLQMEAKFLPGEPEDNRLKPIYKQSNDPNALLTSRLMVI